MSGEKPTVASTVEGNASDIDTEIGPGRIRRRQVLQSLEHVGDVLTAWKTVKRKQKRSGMTAFFLVWFGLALKNQAGNAARPFSRSERWADLQLL